MPRSTRRSDFIPIAACLLAGTLIPSAPLSAQGGPARSTGDDLVVEGIRDRDRVIDHYVDGLTVASPDQPLARYQAGEYCPAVLGLDDQRNAEIARRMRNVASAAGVAPARQGCVPSALVIFVDDKEAFIADFRKRHPTYFIDLRGRHRGPPSSAGPAVAWHLVQLVDPQGMPVRRGVGGSYSVVESPVGGSRLRSMVTSVVAMSVVVIERSALVGLTATQIADYALMRTLSDRDPEGLDLPGGLTILKVLRAPMGSAAPASLTAWDLAYLKGRYSGHLALYGPAQGAAIRNSMRRVLADAAGK